MPTYQYRCRACGEPLEAVQSFADPPLTTCVECGGALRKVFSPVGVVFKGSGFYKTDSRSAPRSDGAGKDGVKDGVSKDGAAAKDGATGAKNGATEPTKGGAGATSEAGARTGAGRKPDRPAKKDAGSSTHKVA